MSGLLYKACLLGFTLSVLANPSLAFQSNKGPADEPPSQLTVLAWNIEIGGSELDTIQSQLKELKPFDILGLSEVTRKDLPGLLDHWPPQLAEADKASSKKEELIGGSDVLKGSNWFAGEKGGPSCLLLCWNPAKLEARSTTELIQFDGQDLAPGIQAAPLIVQLRHRQSQQEFLVVMSHLARGSAELRMRQATALVQWAKQQKLPVIAIGGYNFDFDFRTQAGNDSFKAFLADGTWKWIQPKQWVDTNWADRNRDGKDDYPDSMLDFVFTSGPAKEWDVSCEVVVRPNDFPDTDKTSDQRPIRTVVKLAGSPGDRPSTSDQKVTGDKVRILDQRVVSHHPSNYHGWSTLARRKNGDLMLVCSGGRESHVCPFGQLEWMRSKDQGATWSWPQVLYDGPIDDRDAGVVETSLGSILVTNFTSLAYEPILAKAESAGAGQASGFDANRLLRWQAVHRQLTAEQRKQELGTYMLRSTDGGVTWSHRYRVPVNSPHGPIVLRDGRLLYPGKSFEGDGRIGVCESKDDGLTWAWLGTIDARPGDSIEKYHELHGVEASDGTLICHIRNENQQDDGETLQSESTDGGRTWSTPHRIGVWGLPSHLLRLKDGRLLMSYGYRRPPFGNQIRISSDHGKTWGAPQSLSEDGIGGDLGYPATVECDDGMLVTVWYEVLEGKPQAQLRQVRWRLE